MSGKADYHGYATFQEFLDNVQYSRVGILSYEKIFGHTHVSTGGQSTTDELFSGLPLKPDSAVLDVGCGIGGTGIFLAQQYGCRVEGIDLSTNMISIGHERLAAAKLQDKVALKIADCTTVEYPDATFDLIYSRDTILHIEDKLSLFRRFHSWLKPGGSLLITDYCSSPKPWPEDYAAYVKQRGYNVMPVKDYGQLIERAGFQSVEAIDHTERFMQALKVERQKLDGLKDEFVKELGEQMYQYIVDGWESKIGRVNRGVQKWGLFRAQKAAN